MLADPGLVEAEAVEVLDPGQIVVQGQGRVLPDGVEGARKIPNRRGECIAPA
ncbi:MAG: hypothetical protein WKF43_06010 [Acidimicrobiales bacterium]